MLLSLGEDQTKVTLKTVRPCLCLSISWGPSTCRGMQNCASIEKNSLCSQDVGWSEQGLGAPETIAGRGRWGTSLDWGDCEVSEHHRIEM